jgi:large subunit ribosomal protein L7Ae
MKYRTESRKEKRERLKKEAEAMKDKKETKTEDKKPVVAKFGLNHVTSLVENNEAKLVVIAHNVEPIELVLHLPTLCCKKDIPYCFVKGTFRLSHIGMERLGKVVNKKHVTCLALTEVKKEVK